MSVAKGKALLSDNFFEEIGGYSCLRRVHNILYTKLFTHPWLKGFFLQTKREIVESQQTDFWASLMGGPSIYGGRSPRDAHVHMFRPAEVFAIRHKLLGDALVEAGVAADLREKWLAMDANFERAIVNQSPDECHGRYRTESVIIVPRPDGF
ncbi:MAG: group I truncated hemoglobin [Alphaproteobacteria bacterium]